MSPLPLSTPTPAPANAGSAERPPPAPGNPGDVDRPPAGLPLPALVFCRSRKRVEGVARELASSLGWDRVGAYHAGLSREERAAVEEWFFAADNAVLVATCAYGMGVDKSNIRTTIHYDLPASVEAFLQESGRAGRDGGQAESIVLFGHEDTEQANSIEDPVRRERYELLLEYCYTSTCRREYLMRLLGAELEACFGCDNCRENEQQGGNDAAVTGAPVSGALLRARESIRGAAVQLLRFVRRNNRLLTIPQVARLLLGVPESADRWTARRLPQRATLESFRGWTPVDVGQLIDGTIRAGGLVRMRRGPWRNRLATTGRNCIRD